jgi:hypothetical protein
MFEVFHRMSRARPGAAGAAPTDDDKPRQKRHRQVLLKKMQTPRYSHTWLYQVLLAVILRCFILQGPVIIEVSNPADRNPSAVVVLPPLDTAIPGPSFSVVAAQAGLGLMACDYISARASA